MRDGREITEIIMDDLKYMNEKPEPKKDIRNWKYSCPNCGRINIQDSKRPTDKCHRCGFERRVKE
jgi:DNA-directed RNA polymerase subunit RPC12/RpoP